MPNVFLSELRRQLMDYDKTNRVGGTRAVCSFTYKYRGADKEQKQQTENSCKMKSPLQITQIHSYKK